MFLECKSDHATALNASVFLGTHSSPLSTSYLLFRTLQLLFSPLSSCLSASHSVQPYRWLHGAACPCISALPSPSAVYTLSQRLEESSSPFIWLTPINLSISTFHQLLREPAQRLPLLSHSPFHAVLSWVHVCASQVGQRRANGRQICLRK